MQRQMKQRLTRIAGEIAHPITPEQAQDYHFPVDVTSSFVCSPVIDDIHP
jgi:hypothetical protein